MALINILENIKVVCISVFMIDLYSPISLCGFRRGYSFRII